MGRRGRKRQLEVEARYWRLLQSGVGTVEACRQVGITRKTGYRWRAEAGGLVPVRLAEAVRSNRYLSLLERQRIAALHRQGVSVREIARCLDRNASTVSRELRRNTAVHDRGRYGAPLAHARARARGARPGRSRLATDPALRAVVQEKLELEWSPEQIAGHLRSAFPDRPAWHVCHETIYQALYRGARGGLNRRLTGRLRTGRPLRKRRRRADQRRSRYVVPYQRIEHRPAIVSERSRLGDWEGDLVVGPMSRSAVATLVERRSRFLRLVHLPEGHRSDHLLAALHTAMTTVPAVKRLTLTWDQGSEMARHDAIARLFSEGVYFANPGSPWMRGTNENTNGLLRQYLPKGTDLRIHDAADLAAIEAKLNNRPRKKLSWRTPAEVFAAGP
jgi:transposase, IS30 family